MVNLAGDAAALGFDGPGAQMAQKEDVLKGRANVLGNALKPL